ncbi:MAG: cytochrome C [Deltaproteobacteria bacterium]|nr:MAG: cytochrome C [Deltaproteobacteria bacterium]
MHRYSRIVGTLALLLLLPLPLLAEQTPTLSGTIEFGGKAVSVQDDSSRVNEYIDSRREDGITPVGRFDLDIDGGPALRIETEGDLEGPSDQRVDTRFELSRAVRGYLDYSVLEHLGDHDRLDYIDASIARPGASADPANPNPWPGTLTPNAVPGFMLVDVDASGNEFVVRPVGGVTSYAAAVAAESAYLAANPNSRIAQTGGAAVYGEDLLPGAVFSVTRREVKTGADIQIPSLPNLTFNLDFRNEHRKGTEQAISMSKCGACHITGEGKEIDEVTRDLKAGVTGKFGVVTLQYEFADRQFENNADAATTIYDPVIKPGQPLNNATFDNRMSYDYDDGLLPYDRAPDSEKRTHTLKAQVDLAKRTSLLGSYVNSKVESRKTDEPGIFTLDRTRLTTSYDGYGIKATTRLGGVKLNARLRLEELDSDNVTPTFYPITAPSSPAAGLTFGAPAVTSYQPPGGAESIITRDVLTAGLDASYRLTRGAMLRLGWEMEKVDREDEHFGETETHTLKARLNYRVSRKLSTRVGYTYQNIDNPFGNPDAALVPLQANTFPSGVTGDSAAYGTTFYDAREADLSNQPEEVHEGKITATWAPSPRFSATVNYRYRDESNDLNRSEWQQRTHAPGVSLWYAPNQNFQLTAAYNYFDQRSETAFCQGFYDG